MPRRIIAAGVRPPTGALIERRVRVLVSEELDGLPAVERVLSSLLQIRDTTILYDHDMAGASSIVAVAERYGILTEPVHGPEVRPADRTIILVGEDSAYDEGHLRAAWTASRDAGQEVLIHQIDARSGLTDQQRAQGLLF